MGKICIIDPVSPKGHVFFNSSFINEAAKYRNIDVYIKDGYFDSTKLMECVNIKYINNKVFPIDPKTDDRFLIRIIHWIKCIYSLFVIRKKISKTLYEKIILLDYNYITTIFINLLFIKRNVYLVNHRISTLNRTSKKICIRLLHRKIKHIVFQEYIKNYLEEIGIKNDITVIWHPLPEVKDNRKIKTHELFAPGGSNSDEWINLIIEKEETINNICKKHNIKLRIKSNNKTFKKGNIIIYSDYLDKEEYNRYIEQCMAVLQFYSKQFDYTVSGVFYEALSNMKPVLGFKNNFLEYYYKSWGCEDLLFSNLESFLEVIQNLYLKIEQFEKDMENNIIDYNDKLIIQMEDFLN